MARRTPNTAIPTRTTASARRSSACGLVGVYVSRREGEGAQTLRTNIDTPVATLAGALQGFGLDADTAAAVAGLYAMAQPVIPVDYIGANTTEAKNRALFADGEYRFNETWSLLAGFRYDRESHGFDVLGDAQIAGSLPDPDSFAPVLGPMAPMVIGGINQYIQGIAASASALTPWNAHDFTAFLPKAGVRLAFDADRSLAFTVQRGYRSGGSSYNIARAQAFAHDPEYTVDYELALRTQWLDGRLSFNANTYYIDWKDKQVTAFFSPDNIYDYHVINAAKAHLYGAEAEARYRVSEGFDWYAALGHSRTRYDQLNAEAGASVADYSGHEFAYAPRWTLSVGGNARWGEGWVANLNANYRDRMQGDVGAGSYVHGSRTVVNGRFGYEASSWSAYAFASNLLDAHYTQYVFQDDPNVILGAPRVVGVGLEYAW